MTTMRTTTRRWTTGLLVVAAMALLASCGGDDADETTTTAAEATSTTLSEEEFTAEVDGLMAQLDAAGTDLCSVLEVAGAPGPGMPTSPAMVRSVVDGVLGILRSLAATEPVDPEAAAGLNELADTAEEAIAAEDYSVEYFESEEFRQLIAGEDIEGALAPYQTRASEECVPTPTTTVAGETPTTVAG